jgi:hypothetical protein
VAAERAGEPLGVHVAALDVPEHQRVIAGQGQRQRAPFLLPPRRTAAVPGSMSITCRDRSVLGGGVPCLELQNKMKSGRPPSEKE